MLQPQLVQEAEDLRSHHLQLHGIVVEDVEGLLHAVLEAGIVAALNGGDGGLVAVLTLRAVSDLPLHLAENKLRAVFPVALRQIRRILR